MNVKRVVHENPEELTRYNMDLAYLMVKLIKSQKKKRKIKKKEKEIKS